MDTGKIDKGNMRIIDMDNFDLDEYRNSFVQRRRTAIKNKLKKRLRYVSIFLFISLAGAFFFAVRSAIYYMEFARNQNTQEKAAEIVSSQSYVMARPEETAGPEKIPQAKGVIELEDEPRSVEEPEDIPEERPLLNQIAALRREFSNNDIIGYLSIEGTNINYAVVQCADNTFYLNHDLYGNKNSAGSVFMDFENSVSVFDDNTIVYGHNMANGSMFHNLRYYADKQYFENHSIIYLTTPYEETAWEVFAFYTTDVDFNYIQTDFEDDEQFLEFIAQIMEKSMHDVETNVGIDEKILTLSTCSGNSQNSRFVLNAKLLTN